MKKIILLFILLAQTALFAQNKQTIDKPLQLNSVAAGTTSDDVLLSGATDQIVKKISVSSLLVTKANLASPIFTGSPILPTGTVGVTQAAGNTTTAVATTFFVTTADNLKANLASPTFTGTPNLPIGTVGVTQAAGNSTAALATTAHVMANYFPKLTYLEYNNTDLTIWNNGKGNIVSNCTFGDGALKSITTGASNSAYGLYSSGNTTTGQNNESFGASSLALNVTGSRNAAFGGGALAYNSTSNNNTAVGYYALNNLNITTNIDGNNTAVGKLAGNGIVTGTGNTIVGANVSGLTASLTDNIILGNGTGAIKAQHNGTNWTFTGQLNKSALDTAPASATATGTAGEIRYTATHIYVCTATNTWVRSALTTW